MENGDEYYYDIYGNEIPPIRQDNGPAEPGWGQRTWQVIWVLLAIIAVMCVGGWIQSY